ncbi:MAG TPA: hypothetical protein VK772_00865 [Puia sp.]|nr:hypothetical protein [Puia sp.]
MKKQFLRISIPGLVLILISLATSGQATTNEITDKFFSLFPTEPSKAVEYCFSTNKWYTKKIDDVVDLENKVKDLPRVVGEYLGYELLTEKTAGANIKIVIYIVRFEREPMRFTFLFYKPKDKWQVNNFSYDENIDEDLKEASKAYRLKENNNSF